MIDDFLESKDPFKEYVWNEGLAWAARHLVNDQGPCGTFGDINSDTY